DGGASDAVVAPGRLAGLDTLLDAARATTTVTLHDPDGVAASPLPAAADQALFRIAQEAVTNALKHAPGAPVVVELYRHEAAVVLEVRDAGAPGSGTVEAPLSAGTGLLTMRERADGLGGTCSAGPLPAGGWSVRAEIPVAGLPVERQDA
ncbi:MAG: sensor histidine kinase, partial [Cellulosimicrobium funkei]